MNKFLSAQLGQYVFSRPFPLVRGGFSKLPATTSPPNQTFTNYRGFYTWRWLVAIFYSYQGRSTREAAPLQPGYGVPWTHACRPHQMEALSLASRPYSAYMHPFMHQPAHKLKFATRGQLIGPWTGRPVLKFSLVSMRTRNLTVMRHEKTQQTTLRKSFTHLLFHSFILNGSILVCT